MGLQWGRRRCAAFNSLNRLYKVTKLYAAGWSLCHINFDFVVKLELISLLRVYGVRRKTSLKSECLCLSKLKSFI